jgi:hypothetical protein
LAQKHYPKYFGNLEIRISRPAWWLRRIFFGYGTFSIKDGSQIHFWEDTWLGNSPLSEQYLALYSIIHRKVIPLWNALVMATSLPNVTFRCDLIGPRLLAWNALLQHLDSIQLSLGHDKFRWNLIPIGNSL